MKWLTICAVLLALTAAALPAPAQEAPGQPGPRPAPTVQVETMALPVLDTTPSLDVARATAEYVARVPGDARSRADAYIAGGHWLVLLELAWIIVIAGVLMGFGLSARLRNWAEERTHSR